MVGLGWLFDATEEGERVDLDLKERAISTNSCASEGNFVGGEHGAESGVWVNYGTNLKAKPSETYWLGANWYRPPLFCMIP